MKFTEGWTLEDYFTNLRPLAALLQLAAEGIGRSTMPDKDASEAMSVGADLVCSMLQGAYDAWETEHGPRATTAT